MGFLGTEEYELANGEIVEEKVYIGKIVFDGDELQVFSLTNRSKDVLIGTKILKNKILKVTDDKRVVGKFKSKKAYKIIAWITFAFIGIASLFMIFNLIKPILHI
ncbi:MAG: hypothetical protein ACYDIA_19085 [Candidatus Humimicrobiaceae bacterium]